ncbi:MAG: DUF1700 domain-containing protein [Coriobacteriia bacterium]|nr:DUF1700 domain-containing protein [Coriobacteriia bacterium]MCL2745838.1 DUF1700 domain-containing protein [Coriobacteriia bacterium]MCL2870542.1 DUF1700 domain-containing protein [Coriobacteriia bacterium]
MTAKYADNTQAMTKTAFLAELRQRLSVLPEPEAMSAIAYYDEYLSEAGPENEAAAIAELGSPAQIATGILGDHVYTSTTGEDKTIKSGLTAVWIAVVGVLTAPITLPLAFSLIMLIFSLLLTALLVVFSLFIAAIATFIGGVVYLGIGFVTLFSHFATGLATIGTGLALTAFGAALSIVMVWMAKHVVNGAARGGSHLLRRFKTRKGA